MSFIWRGLLVCRWVAVVGMWVLLLVLSLTVSVLLIDHFRDQAGWPSVLVVGVLIVGLVWAFVPLVRSGRTAVRPWPFRLILALLVNLLGVLVLDGASLAQRYGVSFSEGIRGVIKEASLTAIATGVAVHDPFTPRLAGTGPDLGRSPGAGWVRIEELTGDRFVIQEVHNETIVRCEHDFRYQPTDEPRLQELRRRYRLDEVVAPAADEFEAQVLLRGWARSQFRREDYQSPLAEFDALAYLDRNQRNLTGEPYHPGQHLDPCYFFPLLYCQVLLSMGHQARLVSIGHGMVEVWSNQCRKWVLMDAELNWHYEKDGVRLSMTEVFEENFVPGPSRVRVVRGRQTSDPNTALVHLGQEEIPIERLIRAHRTHLVIVDLRNDWLTNHYFRGHPARSERNSLVYSDPRLETPLPFADRLRPRTHRKDDLYWTLNQTEIWARRSPGSDNLQLSFSTVTPNFDHFEVEIDGTPPTTIPSPHFQWQLHEGMNTLAIRSINQSGVRGILSSVKLLVPPARR